MIMFTNPFKDIRKLKTQIDFLYGERLGRYQTQTDLRLLFEELETKIRHRDNALASLTERVTELEKLHPKRKAFGSRG